MSRRFVKSSALTQSFYSQSAYQQQPRYKIPTVEEALSKTQLCKSYKVGCKNIETCNYAHTHEELKPKMCRFSKGCTFIGKGCKMLHPGDKIPTMEELVEESSKNVQFIEPPTDQIIINFDEDDYDSDECVREYREDNVEDIYEYMKRQEMVESMKLMNIQTAYYAPVQMEPFTVLTVGMDITCTNDQLSLVTQFIRDLTGENPIITTLR